MRFLGNKESIKYEILKLLDCKGLMDKGFTFFDAFCGSGAVAEAVKSHFSVVINDILNWCVIYTKGRMYGGYCEFSLLGFNPFDHLNTNTESRTGFIYANYSPGGSNRMYFTAENAGRIDYFRFQIEEWKNCNLITDAEYTYLLACLIESVSRVSNTAGVYGAFLKEWDPRATKPIQFLKIDSSNNVYKDTRAYNNKIEEIIADVDCDVLYIDPPYTQNQYGTQYHLLETIVLNDNPPVSKVTGSRPVTPMRSDWSKEYKANILFDEIISKTKAKHIVFSYNSDGFMSKEFIESCLKRYGIADTFICKKISYKKYRNWKTKRNNEHFEYLFYVKKNQMIKLYTNVPLIMLVAKQK